MSRKLGAEINLDYDNTQLALASRLPGANSGVDDIFSADLFTLVSVINEVSTFNTGAATTFALTYPLSVRNDFNPDAGVTVTASLPAYDATQCPLGQLFEVRNIGGANSAVQIFDSNGNFIANTSIPPGAAFISRLIAVAGVLTLDVIRIGSIAAHDVSEFLSIDGGQMAGAILGNTDTPTDPRELVPKTYVDSITPADIGAQPASTNLTSVAGIPDGVGLVAKINSGTGAAWAARLITSSDGSLGVTNSSGLAGNIDLSVSKGLTIIPASASLTLSAIHNGTTIWMTNTSDATVTVPSTLTPGFNCKIIQMSTGPVTIAGSGVTLTSADNVFKTRTTGSDINLILDTATVGWVGGDLVP